MSGEEARGQTPAALAVAVVLALAAVGGVQVPGRESVECGGLVRGAVAQVWSGVLHHCVRAIVNMNSRFCRLGAPSLEHPPTQSCAWVFKPAQYSEKDRVSSRLF